MGKELFTPIPSKVKNLVDDVRIGKIGLPDLQRPFVWKDNKVRDLFDSMFRGYPVGFLLFWAAAASQNSKQIGNTAHGTDAPSLLIIDGQQRLTSLYAVMKGIPVLDKNFQHRTIKIAFHPEKGEFAVSTAAIARSPEWIANISELFTQSGSSRRFVNCFIERLVAAQGDITGDNVMIVVSTVIAFYFGTVVEKNTTV